MSSQAKFVLRGVFFATPIFVVVMSAELLFWRCGETWPIGRVLEEQRSRDVIWMRAVVDEQVPQYKLRMLEERQTPVRVVVLGSSRVLKIRSEMFGLRKDDMLNLGSLVHSVRELEVVAALAERVKPELIIIGVDSWWFNPQLDDEMGVPSDPVDDRLAWQAHALGVREFLANGHYLHLLQWFHPPNGRIGGDAIEKNVGFRPDGSLKGEAIPSDGTWQFVDRAKPPIATRIRLGISKFVPSSGIDHERVARFSKLLNRLHDDGIEVAVFSPPFASQSLDLLQQMPAHRTLFEEFNRMLPEVAENAHAVFVDGSSPTKFGLDDRAMLDGFHAEETFHVYLVEKVLCDPALAKKFPDAPHVLARAIASARTNFWQAELSLY